MKIAVLGGGHGAYAAAADLSEQGHEVRLWRRDAAALKAVLDSGTIKVTDIHGSRAIPIACATADLAEAVRSAQLVLIPAPATAQEDIARALAQHLENGQVVFLPPGTFGSYVMSEIVRSSRFARRGHLGRDRHAALPGAQAVGRCGAHHHPGCAAADRSLSRQTLRARFRGHPPGLSGDRALRRRAVRGADERRTHHPPTADPDERGAAAAFRALGHSQRRDAAVGPRSDRPARSRAHRGARGAGLPGAALSARATTTPATAGCTATRTSGWWTRATGASTSICTPTAT